MAMIEVLRSGVQAWECDHMGHWNVRYYFQKAGEGMARLAAELGLPPRARMEGGRGFVAREQHVRFLRELRPGTPYRVTAGVLQAGRDQLRVYSEIYHLSRDEPAAAVTSVMYLVELQSRRAVPLPASAIERAGVLSCELPAHAAPRGLSSDPPGPQPSAAESSRRGMTPAFFGPVRAELCDEAGFLTPGGHMACVSDGIGHLFQATSRTGRPPSGGAALEYRFAYHNPIRRGDLLEIYSAFKGFGAKTKHLCHHMFDVMTGDCVATSEAIAVNFDLQARRVVPLSDEERAHLQSHVVDGVGL